ATWSLPILPASSSVSTHASTWPVALGRVRPNAKLPSLSSASKVPPSEPHTPMRALTQAAPAGCPAPTTCSPAATRSRSWLGVIGSTPPATTRLLEQGVVSTVHVSGTEVATLPALSSHTASTLWNPSLSVTSLNVATPLPSRAALIVVPESP